MHKALNMGTGYALDTTSLGGSDQHHWIIILLSLSELMKITPIGYEFIMPVKWKLYIIHFKLTNTLK